MEDIISTVIGKKILALGNEAIARGALEGGVDMVTAYPGTPSTEIGTTFQKIAEKVGVYFEYSVNEKVALEVAISAAMSGMRCLTFMKQVGLNVAGDPLMTYCYIGHRGAHVIVSADDPSCHSSQNEQDNRLFARFANLPMLEPSNPNEAKEMTRYGMEISAELEQPVMLRTTTRISHTRGVLELKEIEIKDKHRKVTYEKEYLRFTKVPALAYDAHMRVLDVMRRAEEISEKCPFTFIRDIKGDPGKDEIAIITSGVSYGYVVEAVESLDLNARILRIGMTNPLPRSTILEFMKSSPEVIVVEEVEPYLERDIKVIAKDGGLDIPVLGKENGHFPRIFEYSIDIVRDGIASALGMELKKPVDLAGGIGELELPRRPPTLCPGCPHRAAFYVARKLNRDEAIYCNDIGCYTLGLLPPLKTADMFVCMGASSGLACGLAEATDQRPIAFVGDSTFFHSGLPGLINAVHQGHRFIYVVLDNSTTAMTGHQPHPGIPEDAMGREAPVVDIRKVVESLGVSFVEEVNPLELDAMEDVFGRAMEHESVAVIIAREPCTLLKLREMKERGEVIKTYYVDREKCKKCKKCINTLACPAFYVTDGEVFINASLCSGCGVCGMVCPFDSISQVGGDGK